jgi:predicted transcriptional regulator of viral defense system
MSAERRISPNGLAKAATGWGEREKALHRLAQCQHGVVSVAQLHSLGLAGSTARARASVGRLHRIHHGVYALGRPDLPVEGNWMAAVLACGPGSVLSHISAAALHGLLSSTQTTVDVIISRRSGLARSGIRVHRSTCLIPADRTSVNGIPCTSVARTLLDLAGVVHRRALERACDQAEVLRLFDCAAIDDMLSRARGAAGVRKLRAVLEAGHVGEGIPRSELEGRFLRLCLRSDLPPPEVNVWMTVEGEEMQVDFLWRKHRVVVEVDGFGTHGTRLAFQRDRRRGQLLTLAGWQAIRFTWNDVTSQPGRVTELLRRLL